MYENREENDEQPPPQMTIEEYLAERKSTLRRRSWWAIGIGGAVVGLHLLVFFLAVLFKEQLQQQYPDIFDGEFSWKILFQSLFFILGLFAIAGGLWGLREARRLSVQDLIPSPEAIAFAQQAQEATPYFSYALVGCIVAVYIAQYYADFQNPTTPDELPASIQIAGLMKNLVRNNGEYWRILTSATLHAWLLHIYFNGQALFGFGSLIEYLSNRAHLAIVFLLAIIGGGLMSVYFLPEKPSVGASGGIMGLVGYLAIYGYRRKRQLPPDFLKNMLINIGFIAAFGIAAYQFVDNFAHLGGLLVGMIYGLIQIPRKLDKNPRAVGWLTEACGYLALGGFVFISVFTILLLVRIIIL